jgi:hypothetical protein
VAGAFPLEAPLVTTSGAGELLSRSFLVTRVARSPWEASPELEASLKSREPAVAPSPVPAAGTVACMFNTSLGLEGVPAAGSGGSSNPARTAVSYIAFIVTSRIPSWLGGSEDAQAAASFPVATPSVAGGRGAAAPVGAISPAGVESTSGAAIGLETVSADTSGWTGSSVLVSLATGSNRGSGDHHQCDPSSRQPHPCAPSCGMRGWEPRSRFPWKKERGEVALPNQRKGETYKKGAPRSSQSELRRSSNDKKHGGGKLTRLRW